MAIKINLESIKIPVEIGDLKFEIDVTDEKYESFIKNFNAFLTKMESLDEDDVEDIAQLKVAVSEVYEDLLGTDSYEQIYEKMPNIAFVASVLVNIVTQLMAEMDERITPTSVSKMKTVAKKQPKKK